MNVIIKQVINYTIRMDDEEWGVSNHGKEKNVLRNMTTESET